jgi:outer membrane biosynthesis protein TonB
MVRSDRPRPKSPFAGDGSWNTPAEPPRARGESAPRAPLLLVAVAGVAVLLAGVVAALLVRAPPGPPATQLAAVERSAAPPVPAASAASAEPSALTSVVVPVAAASVPTRSASPSPVAADVRKAVQTAIPRLKACYEQALRTYPTAGGQATLVLQVGADGRVTEANVTGATPASLAACMQKVATTMLFAAGDAPRAVSIPVALNSQ